MSICPYVFFIFLSQPIGLIVLGFNNYEYLDMTSFRKSSMFITSTDGKSISFSTLKWWSSVTMNFALAAMAQSNDDVIHT